MNSIKLNILFVISKSRIRKDNKASLVCRLTYNKKRKVFSTGQFVNPSYWNSKKQQVKPPAPNRDEINTQLSLIKTKINRAFLMLQVQEYSFTVDDVYRLYKGEKLEKEHNVVEYFEVYLNKLKTLVGKDIKQVTWNKYSYVKMDIKSFIKWKYKTNDIPLKKLEPNFLTELEYYFKVVKEIKQITINKKLQRFRKIVKVAVSEHYLEKDPFLLYKAKRIKKDIVFLDNEELQALENHTFSQERLNRVKNMFLFSCYTGLAYKEVVNLKRKNIVLGFDGNLWIEMTRQKTNKKLSIPLLEQALAIIKLTRQNNSKEEVFSCISNQKYNSYLKEVADIVGIDKRLTTHVARRTFASTVLLFNNVPMEIVSKLLGHSSIKVTQDSYAQVVNKQVSNEFNKLKNKLK
ncbi:site-specific integrase [Mangrovimonas cancribranchiae]|uniref:Site-specific integrase n=1 Tax=Mangrovimonas cancribranchiae TaxID=3080055 RepID=A0AAU6P6K6_9FLAO